MNEFVLDFSSISLLPTIKSYGIHSVTVLVGIIYEMLSIRTGL